MATNCSMKCLVEPLANLWMLEGVVTILIGYTFGLKSKSVKVGRHHRKGRRDRLFTLVQTWAHTFYAKYRAKCSSRILPRARRMSFYIHGLWPQFRLSRYLRSCFDPDKLNDRLICQLESEWPNLYDLDKSPSFWNWEWNHGRQAGMDQNTYFAHAVRLKAKYDLKYALQREGIFYQLEMEERVTAVDLHDAIKNVFGKGALIQCLEIGGRKYLYQIYLLFDYNLTLVDYSGFKGCTKEERIYL